ncbi:hypothetical protein Poli38472_006200 [Pythium oligandrum]|uniref:Uncharacterized protein n=1 Tax=Pythium oligandrum TaxID=41045 RepID=A0A8K1FR86_PYTOL|nr:hypothetical protein Poli38472_006200 [Pythium oligandrum]|eukprot:TMW68732.1 hypothetical protein Poli38472_006200 [Pythium oligandrum]
MSMSSLRHASAAMTFKHIKLVLYVLMTAVMMRYVPLVQATEGSLRSSSSGSNAIAIGSDSLMSVWAEDDMCSQPESSYGCLTDVRCSTCLTRAGCAIESTTGKCVSVSRINSTNVGVEYFEYGKAEYCAASDEACASCREGGDESVCRGANGCVCVKQCEVQETKVISCEDKPTKMRLDLYLVLIGAGLLPIIIIYRIRRILGMPSAFSRCFGRRRRPAPRRPAANAENPMALKLEGWRQHMQEHKDQFTDLELKGCFGKIDNDLEEGRPTEDSDWRSTNADSIGAELDDDYVPAAYVCVSTPRESSGDASRSARV